MAKRKSWDEKNKYIHSSRKKVIDTVFGKDTSNTKRTFGYEGVTEKRKLGDIWEDEFWRYEQKEGFVLKTGKNHEVYQEIRKLVRSFEECQNSDCEKQKLGPTDKAYIRNTGFCIDCLTLIEDKIKLLGVWETYEKWRMFQKAIGRGKDAIAQITQGIKDLKPYYEQILENGQIERWDLPKPIDEMRKEMEDEIQTIQKGVSELEEDIVILEDTLKKVDNPLVQKLFNGNTK
jgi:hypothetical protein